MIPVARNSYPDQLKGGVVPSFSKEWGVGGPPL